MTFLPHEVVWITSIVELVMVATLLPLAAAIGGHLVCHQRGCFRLGRFRHGRYKLCHKHHPLVPSDGRITSEEIDGQKI